jgi:uncharacterized damage-inducible protein DinB
MFMKAQLLDTLEKSRQYTLDVAAQMPANAYSFKPVDTVWNFGELMHHIAYGILWWGDNYIKGTETAWNPPPAGKAKKEAVAYLEQAYQSLKETLNKQTLNEEAVKGFHATIDHITHHRGQAVLHLRCKGIAPPEYVY